MQLKVTRQNSKLFLHRQLAQVGLQRMQATCKGISLTKPTGGNCVTDDI